MKWNHWIIISLAVWLLLSPWILGYSQLNLIVWNNIAVAALTIVFIFWNLSDNNKIN